MRERKYGVRAIQVRRNRRCDETERAYVVGRVSSCEYCGRHIEMYRGRCDEMKCTCRHTFKFIAFRSRTQVSNAITSAQNIHLDIDLG